MATDDLGIDLSKLGYAALIKLSADASAMAEVKKGEELKTLVNGWKMKAEQNGLSMEDVIAEFRNYMPAPAAKKTRAAPGTVAPEAKPYVIGVVYKNPNGPETWTGGTKGRFPRWLSELVPADLSVEEKKKRLAALAT